MRDIHVRLTNRQGVNRDRRFQRYKSGDGGTPRKRWSHGGEQLRHKREEANAAVEAIEARGGQTLAIQADIARLRRQVVRVATVGTVLNFPGGTCSSEARRRWSSFVVS